jgi:hypothetical protein
VNHVGQSATRRPTAWRVIYSVATEMSQFFWPRGFFAGRFDRWDIVAYGVGLLTCYAFDMMSVEQRRRAPLAMRER